MCRMGASRVQAGEVVHSSGSRWIPSTLGMERREERAGWAEDWPARKWVAAVVRMRRMERLG